MNKLQVFNNSEFGEIRTIEIKGEPWFVGKDIVKILGYTDISHAILDHVDDEDRINSKTQGQFNPEFGQRGTWLINESGLYSLILSSKLPTAKKFKNWVTSEVLPTIRKTGGYVNNDEMFINTYLSYADERTKAMFKQTLQTLRMANEKIEQDKPKVIFADAVAGSKTSILIGDLAKLLYQNGIQMGQNRLFSWMRENGYLICRNGSDYNSPTQKSMEMGLFDIKETVVTHSDGHISINKTTKVTGKGQQYFINLFLGNKKEK